MEKQKPAPLEEWQRAAIAVEPRGFMADIIAYRRSDSQSLIPSHQRSEPKPTPGNGWQEATPIAAVPGVKHMDAIAESFARVDHAAAVRVRIDNELAEVMMGNKTANKAKTEYDPLKRYDDEAAPLHREKKKP